MIRGEKVYLRPVRQADLALLESWNVDPKHDGEFNDFGFHPSGPLQKRFAEDGLIGSRQGELLVVNYDDEVVGSVSYHQERYGPNEGSIAYNIGISLSPEYRGKGYGSEAQKLLAAYLFAIYPIMRVEASTDIENIPEQKALEKAGFQRDGVMRKAQWRTGDWHDIVVYSKLRGE
ncbi:MAG TPA: GNAT family protein [Ktedonobacteraceae bacterium]|jgi:aminoglycoside 6'-N-acetyltransferase|nr:GNAT family protein [Ktedonobacteraceae bacterium]